MCNDFGNHIPYSDYLAAFSQTRILRSEGRRFPVGRCLIPASHFFEFTETKSPKQKWKFTKAGEDWFCFAGLWRPMPEGGEAFTLLTTAPGPDVALIHDRQMVVLHRSEWSALAGSRWQ
jgi:putative SOS response-associated peptidase YedK